MTKNAQRLMHTDAQTHIPSRKAAEVLDLPQKNSEQHPKGLKSIENYGSFCVPISKQKKPPQKKKKINQSIQNKEGKEPK